MKIIIKEISQNGDKLIVYHMTNTNQPISCEPTTNEGLKKVLSKFSSKVPKERYTYEEYLKQDLNAE